MKKRSNKNKGLYLFLIVVALLVLGCNDKKEQEAHAGHAHSQKQQDKVYTCPMHPEIIRSEPGPCPICGMDLVEKGVTQNMETLSPGTIVEPENETVLRQAQLTSPVKKK